jgi:hypothetical protein
MPIVPFDTLPDDARVWVFGSDVPVVGAPADTLLAAVDDFLSGWHAHGTPLACARTWRDDRFLAVGVDVSQEMASGCSIDGLFRTLQRLEREIGAQLVGAGRVFYRGSDARVHGAPRANLSQLVSSGEIGANTPVFDLSITTAGAWRERFEQRAGSSWASGYFAAATSG